MECLDSVSSRRTSLPFIAFETICAAFFIISSLLVRKLRRQSEVRAQQRYDRMSRFEIISTVYNPSSMNVQS